MFYAFQRVRLGSLILFIYLLVVIAQNSYAENEKLKELIENKMNDDIFACKVDSLQNECEAGCCQRMETGWMCQTSLFCSNMYPGTYAWCGACPSLCCRSYMSTVYCSDRANCET